MADVQDVNKAINDFKVEDDDNQTAMLKTKAMLRAMPHISNWAQSLLHVCNLARSLDLIFEKLYRDHSKIVASIASSKVILDGMMIYINNSNWKEKIKTPELKQYVQLEIDVINHVKNDAGTYDVKKSQELLARIEAKLDEIKLEI
jgi:hypothetical protein